jgi:hypothetical protein
MTLRLILTVDEGDAAELVALLAKALGRGELGIMDFRLEAAGRPGGHEAPFVAPKKLAHAKVAKPYKRGRKSNPTGGGRFAVLKPHFEKGPMHLADIRQVFRNARPPFATNGLSSAVSAWIKYGLIEKAGQGRTGLYKLKGAP